MEPTPSSQPPTLPSVLIGIVELKNTYILKFKKLFQYYHTTISFPTSCFKPLRYFLSYWRTALYLYLFILLSTFLEHSN